MDLTSCTDKSPRCQPSHAAPSNGDVQCSQGNAIGSECSFECNAGYQLEGEATSVCQENQQWDNSAPVCRPIVCLPPHVAPADGRMSCSDENRANSRCLFSCNVGFVREGESVSRCQDNGQWSSPAPFCREIFCLPALLSPTNGAMVCTDDVRVGSICSFECEEGYALEGNRRSTCNEEGGAGVWSNPTPVCEAITCLPIHVAPANGEVVCTNSNFFASVCEFTCEPEYFMIGDDVSVCGRAPSGGIFGIWSNRAPVCQRKSCPPIPVSPVNGQTLCSDGNFVGSVCEFICDNYHRLEGDYSSQCIEFLDGTLNWDKPVPTCEPNLCDHQEALAHGVIDCTKDNFATSQCNFRCTTPTYSLYPPESTSNICQNNTEWNIPMPCCARSCPPYAVMDFIVILDSSSSVGDDNWFKMKNFVRNFLDDFSVSPDASHYGIFRYNRAVDTDTQILLNDYPNDIDALLNAFDEIPYDGSGTRTGNAINHAVDVMLKEGNGNRPGARDVVLIITDGKSQDPVAAPSQRLRDTGAIVFVLPIKPPQRNPNRVITLDMDEIVSMTGSEERVITAAIEGGFDALTDEFSVEVSNMICGNPCDHVLHTHEG
uniref:E-selectin n=1 Tax=Phallusia mammillata TaxID=59560 RepID=A0A6F9DR83_9ASCI|nr:E-selectin [Phallusia mammillata]